MSDGTLPSASLPERGIPARTEAPAESQDRSFCRRPRGLSSEVAEATDLGWHRGLVAADGRSLGRYTASASNVAQAVR